MKKKHLVYILVLVALLAGSLVLGGGKNSEKSTRSSFSGGPRIGETGDK